MGRPVVRALRSSGREHHPTVKQSSTRTERGRGALRARAAARPHASTSMRARIRWRGAAEHAERAHRQSRSPRSRPAGQRAALPFRAAWQSCQIAECLSFVEQWSRRSSWCKGSVAAASSRPPRNTPRLRSRARRRSRSLRSEWRSRNPRSASRRRRSPSSRSIGSLRACAAVDRGDRQAMPGHVAHDRAVRGQGSQGHLRSMGLAVRDVLRQGEHAAGRLRCQLRRHVVRSRPEEGHRGRHHVVGAAEIAGVLDLSRRVPARR